MKQQIKFGEVLKKLIEIKGITRKEVCSHLGISAPALTQYLKGNAKPTFEKLIILAELFDVSLDYLVFGKTNELQSIDYGPLAHYIDTTLSDLHKKNSNHMAIFTKLSQGLCNQVNNIAKKIIMEHKDIHANGLLQDKEVMTLEEYSEQTYIISMNLDHDILHLNKNISFTVLQVEDILEPYTFLQKITQPVNDTHKAIHQKFSSKLKHQIQVSLQLEHLLPHIVTELNYMIYNNLFYTDPAFYSFVKTTKRDDSQKIELWQLNKQILEQCFYKEIRKNNSSPAKFLPIVAQNILKNRNYRFLLPNRQKDWFPIVTEYLQILQKQCQNNVIFEKCEFRYTDARITNGIVLYSLNKDALMHQKPELYELVQKSLSMESWLGYTISPCEDNQAHLLMDLYHLQNSKQIFEELWKKGKSILKSS